MDNADMGGLKSFNINIVECKFKNSSNRSK